MPEARTETPIQCIDRVLRQMRVGAQLFSQPREYTVLNRYERQEYAEWLDRMASELEGSFTMLRIPVQAMPQIIDAEFVEVRP